MKELRIFYCHGMGGGQDSRIPSVLAEHFAKHSYSMGGEPCRVKVSVRTYSFDPDLASAQISSWISEFKPDLIIGESLGSLHAVSVMGLPHLYVSPAIPAGRIISRYSFASYLPGVRFVLNRIFKPKRPGRQELNFRPRYMKRYGRLYKTALENAGRDYSFAFFGTNDHYMKSGVVDVRFWKENFGDYAMYEGSHYMEQEFLDSMLIPKITEVLGLAEER